MLLWLSLFVWTGLSVGAGLFLGPFMRLGRKAATSNEELPSESGVQEDVLSPGVIDVPLHGHS